MNRGRRGENIFEAEKDRKIFIALLKESADLWDVRICAYCLMTTHYHILAQTPQRNLSRFVRHLNGVYTQRYNRLHGVDGQLFRGRFKSILVVCQYIPDVSNSILPLFMTPIALILLFILCESRHFNTWIFTNLIICPSSHGIHI